MRSDLFFRNRKQRRERVLRKMAAMRAAKKRIRHERIAAGWTPEPRMGRSYPLQIGVRNKITGEMAWVDFKSLRDALRRLAIVQRNYSPIFSPLAMQYNKTPKEVFC